MIAIAALTIRELFRRRVIYVLAALTIIVSLPGTVAGFFGMNVLLPLSDSHPFAFLIVLGIALGLTAVATYIFYKRDWF